jgi:hypothetical protein
MEPLGWRSRGDGCAQIKEPGAAAVEKIREGKGGWADRVGWDIFLFFFSFFIQANRRYF